MEGKGLRKKNKFFLKEQDEKVAGKKIFEERNEKNVREKTIWEGNRLVLLFTH